MSYSAVKGFRGVGANWWDELPDGGSDTYSGDDYEDRIDAAQCQYDTQCLQGQECIGGKCQTPLAPMPSCGSQADCPPNTVCSGGKCYPIQHVECASNDACPAGKECLLGTCVDEMKPVTCSSSSDCTPPNTCQNGICQETVDCTRYWDLSPQDKALCNTSGGSCFSNDECSWLSSTSKCYLDGGSPGYCFQGCDASSCAPGQECHADDGLCYPIQPQPNQPKEPIKPQPNTPKLVRPQPQPDPEAKDNTLMWGLIAGAGVLAIGGGILLAKSKKKQGR